MTTTTSSNHPSGPTLPSWLREDERLARTPPSAIVSLEHPPEGSQLSMSFVWKHLLLTLPVALAQSQTTIARFQAALVSGPSSLVFFGGSFWPDGDITQDITQVDDFYQGVEILPYQDPVASIVPVRSSYPMNPLMTFAPACAVIGATMYCYGGSGISSGISESVWYFTTMDLNTYKWGAYMGASSIGNLTGNSLVTIGEYFYVFGGNDGSFGKQSVTQNTLWRVPIDSLTTSTVIKSSGAPSPRTNFCAANLGTDAMLVYGGAGPNTECLQDTFVFYASNSSWSKIKTPSHPLYCQRTACASLSGKVYLFGGFNPDTNANDPNLLWSFDPTFLSWSPVLHLGRQGAAPEENSDSSMTSVGNKYLVVSGGTSNDSSASSFHFFDTTISAWLSGPPSDLSSFASPTPLSRPKTSSPLATPPAPSSAPTTSPAASSAPKTAPAASSAPPTPPSSTSSAPPTATIAGAAAGGAALLLVGAFFIAKSRRTCNGGIFSSWRSNGSAASLSLHDEEIHAVTDRTGAAALEPASATTAPSPLPLAPPPSTAYSSKRGEAYFRTNEGLSDFLAPGTSSVGDAPSPVERFAPSAPEIAFGGNSTSERPTPSAPKIPPNGDAPSSLSGHPSSCAPEIADAGEMSFSPSDRNTPSAPNIAFLADAPPTSLDRLSPSAPDIAAVGDVPSSPSGRNASSAPGTAYGVDAPPMPSERLAPSTPEVAFIGDAPSSPSERQAPYGSTPSESHDDPPPAYIGAAAATPHAPTIYRALRGYIPNTDDEVGCKPGDQIIVRQVRPDGWAEVLNIWTGEKGLLPIANVYFGEDSSRRGV
ncbi:hypothetical protein BDK51DRAFT_47258 [Blyttiomyces helicus]|uniref:SH3 domain-containing protein n=1 Tax=Blyttiomyces helicus TaxID=388810 RepID=A0A4P9W7G7_9FUNG|nr:hypothetical protein BDK51DRAFT_47258 [Blyttiomyces helicus]|eukprot:RKO86106.1 hypothetical protein BDK51DRAFT_47258 [Blyttiomyces helicus]